MMAVDSSALMAIVLGEPDAKLYSKKLRQCRHCFISTVTVIESRIVTHGRVGPHALQLLDRLLNRPAMEIVPPGPRELEEAWTAFLRYGKGTGHPARLNLGDVFSYALAKTRGVPLLFKGDDFRRTDIAPALPVNGGASI